MAEKVTCWQHFFLDKVIMDVFAARLWLLLWSMTTDSKHQLQKRSSSGWQCFSSSSFNLNSVWSSLSSCVIHSALTFPSCCIPARTLKMEFAQMFVSYVTSSHHMTSIFSTRLLTITMYVWLAAGDCLPLLGPSAMPTQPAQKRDAHRDTMMRTTV
jgi:hypothetical protein